MQDAELETIYVELRQKPALVFQVPAANGFAQVFTGPGLLLGCNFGPSATGVSLSAYDGQSTGDTLLAIFNTASSAPRIVWLGDRGVRVRNALGVNVASEAAGVTLYYVCHPYPW